MHMRPPYARNVVGFFYINSRATQTRDESIVIRTSQRRMCFARRAEVLLDANVNLHRPAGEPGAAAFRQQRWLWYLLHPQQVTIEAPSCVFTAWRCSELNVVDRTKGIRVHTPMLRRIQRAQAICLLESM